MFFDSYTKKKIKTFLRKCYSASDIDLSQTAECLLRFFSTNNLKRYLMKVLYIIEYTVNDFWSFSCWNSHIWQEAHRYKLRYDSFLRETRHVHIEWRPYSIHSIAIRLDFECSNARDLKWDLKKKNYVHFVTEETSICG